MKNKVGFIGLGSMGGMMIKGFISSKALNEDNIFISTRTKEKLNDYKKVYPQINICENNKELASICNIIFICVKPLEVKQILSEIQDSLLEDAHLISIAGCVTLGNLKKFFDGKITKVIPSLTSEVKLGTSLVCHNEKVGEEHKKIVEGLLNSISLVKIISESDFEIAADLTSCAPGLIASIFSEFVKSAMNKQSNLNKKDVEDMVISTLFGTTKLLYENGIKFDEMIRRVATKGGITEEGVKVLERKLPDVFEELFNVTLEKHEIVKSIITKSMESES